MVTIQSVIHASLTNDRRNATPPPPKKKYLKVNTIIYRDRFMFSNPRHILKGKMAGTLKTMQY